MELNKFSVEISQLLYFAVWLIYTTVCFGLIIINKHESSLPFRSYFRRDGFACTCATFVCLPSQCKLSSLVYNVTVNLLVYCLSFLSTFRY